MTKPRRCLVTGGMGFIGFNAALSWAEAGSRVVVVDDLSRRTARRNYAEFRRLRPARVEFVQGDVRDQGMVGRLLRRRGGSDLVLHLAGQVAVTQSVLDPVADFDANARGTLSVLEAVRRHSPRSLVLFASTNKVYGGLPWARLRKREGRYEFVHPRQGVAETAPLDFHSPYGCSKGAADQYVRDYARIYGLRTAVFRQSCIYGPWQYGEADQGWVAWFLIAALQGRPMTLYGDGRQVRDVLYIDDLLALYRRAWERRDRAAGEVFNVGGGIGNVLSLLDLLAWLRRRVGRLPKLRRAGWRPGDQRIYVSDIAKARRVLGWAPRVPVPEGLDRLLDWLKPRV